MGQIYNLRKAGVAACEMIPISAYLSALRNPPPQSIRIIYPDARAASSSIRLLIGGCYARSQFVKIKRIQSGWHNLKKKGEGSFNQRQPGELDRRTKLAEPRYYILMNGKPIRVRIGRFGQDGVAITSEND